MLPNTARSQPSLPAHAFVCAAVLPGCPPAASSWKLRPLDALLSLQRSWQLITSSSLFVRLALCMAIVGVVSEVSSCWGKIW